MKFLTIVWKNLRSKDMKKSNAILIQVHDAKHNTRLHETLF